MDKKINMSVSSKIKQKIFLRDNYKCFYCGNDLKHDFRTTYPSPVSKITVDHVIPKHTGGTGKQSNLVTCCKNCNSKKELIERPIKINK